MTGTEVREYRAEARSSNTSGRVLCQAREQHFVIDGPVWNGFPGEALSPGEAFLAGVAACGVELIEMFAADDGLGIGGIEVQIHGVIDRENPVREDLTVFNQVRMRIEIAGVRAASISPVCSPEATSFWSVSRSLRTSSADW